MGTDRFTLARLRNAMDLPSLVAGARRKGRDFVALCPFHDDKHPSLTISRYQGTWLFKCFVCEAHGDGIDYLSRIEGLDFADALKRASDLTGIPISNLRDATPQQRAEAKAAADEYAFAYKTTRGLDGTLSQWATTAAIRTHEAEKIARYWQGLFSLATIKFGEEHHLTNFAADKLALAFDDVTLWEHRFESLQEAASDSATWEQKVEIYLELYRP